MFVYLHSNLHHTPTNSQLQLLCTYSSILHQILTNSRQCCYTVAKIWMLHGCLCNRALPDDRPLWLETCSSCRIETLQQIFRSVCSFVGLNFENPHHLDLLIFFFLEEIYSTSLKADVSLFVTNPYKCRMLLKFQMRQIRGMLNVFLFVFTITHCSLKAYFAILVRRSNFCHQASLRVSPRESTQRRKMELWARNVR
jgi:hypothetical protein